MIYIKISLTKLIKQVRCHLFTLFNFGPMFMDKRLSILVSFLLQVANKLQEIKMFHKDYKSADWEYGL